MPYADEQRVGIHRAGDFWRPRWSVEIGGRSLRHESGGNADLTDKNLRSRNTWASLAEGPGALRELHLGCLFGASTTQGGRGGPFFRQPNSLHIFPCNICNQPHFLKLSYICLQVKRRAGRRGNYASSRLAAVENVLLRFKMHASK